MQSSGGNEHGRANPRRAALRSRILAHLRARPGNPFVAAVWNGYLAGLVEWGLIDGNVHSRLSNLVPKPGSTEMVEIMLSPDYVDAHPELREEAQSEAAQ
jgi:hypothetical protein